MAIAATDFTSVKRRGLGPGRVEVTGIFTGPASYASGGEALTQTISKAGLGLRRIESIDFQPLITQSDLASFKTAGFDYAVSGSTLGEIHAYDAAGTETAAETDLSGVAARFRAIGY